MALDLTGKEAWHAVGHTLSHGRVIRLDVNPDIGIMFCDDGTERVVAASSLLLTRAQAVKACFDNSDYWAATGEELQAGK